MRSINPEQPNHEEVGALGHDMAKYSGALIDQRTPSDGGTLTWAYVSRTASDELRLTTNTSGAAPRFDLVTGGYVPTDLQGDSQLIATLTVDEARRLAKLLEIDSEGELPMLLRDAAALAIQEGD